MTNLNLTQIELSHIQMAILTRINFLEKWFTGQPNTEGIIEMYKKEIAELKELSEKLYEQT